MYCNSASAASALSRLAFARAASSSRSAAEVALCALSASSSLSDDSFLLHEPEVESMWCTGLLGLKPWARDILSGLRPVKPTPDNVSLCALRADDAASFVDAAHSPSCLALRADDAASFDGAAPSPSCLRPVESATIFVVLRTDDAASLDFAVAASAWSAAGQWPVESAAAVFVLVAGVEPASKSAILSLMPGAPWAVCCAGARGECTAAAGFCTGPGVSGIAFSGVRPREELPLCWDAIAATRLAHLKGKTPGRYVQAISRKFRPAAYSTLQGTMADNPFVG